MSTETNNFDDLNDQSDLDEHGASSPKPGAGPLGILLAPDQSVWAEARKLASDRNTRVEDVAAVSTQDPVIVMQLLRVSNAMYFSAGRPPITTAMTAIQRLGSDVILETLLKLQDRPTIDDEDVSYWVELHRSRCKRTSLVAKIIAEVAARTYRDECQTASLMSCVGEMLAAAYFKDKYIALAEEHSRSGLIYRLSQDLKFDVEKAGIAYLRRNGIPEDIVFPIDREGRPTKPERAIMKPICSAAGEMVDAFDAHRWEKLAPGKRLPSKSALRIINFDESQYLKVYERISEYLFAARMEEEKKKHDQALGASEEVQLEEASETTEDLQNEEDQLEQDILSILSEDLSETPESESEEAEPEFVETNIETIDENIPPVLEDYNLEVQSGEEKPARSRPIEIVSPPQMRSANSNEFVNGVLDMFEQADNSEELLTALMEELVEMGPFSRTALIVVSKNRESAIVVAARGPNIGNGQKLVLDDPLSPLAQCFSKVQSFGSNKSAVSPWGSKAFAVSPIDVDHDTPVALYADCGSDGGLPFEARRIFRNMVDLLNQKLPQIPGGIPVELGE